MVILHTRLRDNGLSIEDLRSLCTNKEIKDVLKVLSFNALEILKVLKAIQGELPSAEQQKP